MQRLDREGARTTLVVVLLVATFILTTLIALRAHVGTIYYRATAEQFVRDWTRVAMDELLRRVENQASFYGTYPILQRLATGDAVPTREELLAAAKDDEARRSARLVKATFRLSGGTLHASAGTSPDVQTWLARALAQPREQGAERRPLHAAIAGKRHLFAWLRASDRVVAIELDETGLTPFFGSAMQIRPLIPPSLARGQITNETIFVRALNSSGHVAFATRGAFDPQIGVRQQIEEGLLRGWTVETSIARDTARLLAIGGLAQSPPIHFAFLALAGLLLLVAVLQVRKERALTRLRSDFVSSVSHELRTPLTQIRMFAETLLLDRVRSDEERRRSLTVIDQETRRLAQLVENVLQFSRGERGTLRITRAPHDLGAVVRDAVETFLPIAKARGVRVTTNIDEGAVAVIDDDAMRQVVLNFLDNAVKYGPDGQEVIVTVETTNGVVRLAVDDKGPGIPQRERRRIWRRYERLPRERERAIAGAGIGLAVVRDIVALHGGTVRVEESARGGARFVVELPRESGR